MNNTTKTIVLGHKNPYIYSISAVYAYAGLKKSFVVTGGDERLIEEPPYMIKGENKLFGLPGILSHKKQLLPELLDLFKGIS